MNVYGGDFAHGNSPFANNPMRKSLSKNLTARFLSSFSELRREERKREMKSTCLPGASNVKLVVQSQGNPHTGRHKNRISFHAKACMFKINKQCSNYEHSKLIKTCFLSSSIEIIPAKTVTGTKMKLIIAAQGVFILLLTKTPVSGFDNHREC